MPWPEARLVTFPRSPLLTSPSFEALFITGVPKRLFSGRYEALDALVPIPGSGTSTLVCFAHSFQGNHMCVDSDSGEVQLLTKGLEPRFVNTNLPLFVCTMQAIADRFPYYGMDHTDDEVDAATNDVERLIRDIDPPADSSPYWDTFIRDLSVGDLNTEDILAYESEHSTQEE